MIATLRWIATVGLCTGIASLAVAYALEGPNIRHAFDRGDFMWSSCRQPAMGAGSERHLTWTGGDTLDVALPAHVRLRIGQGDDVVLRGAPEAIAQVQLRDGHLSLDCRWHASWRDIEVTLPVRTLRKIHVAGSATIEVESLSQPQLELKISGSGSVTGHGSVDRLSIDIAGSGDARLGDIATKQLIAKVSGSGNIEAAPKDEANIRIAGSGNVRLLTRPAQLKTHVSGSGRISVPGVEAADRKI